MAQTTTQINQAKAVALLLSGNSIPKVAAEIGLSEKAIDKWLKQPEFRSQLIAGSQSIVDATVANLIALNTRCVEVLLEVLNSDNDKNRIAAVRLIFEHTTKWLGNDAVQRIERLESILLESEND